MITSPNVHEIKISCQPFKAQSRQMVTFRSAQCHPSLTYISNFWHLGTLALRAECQSARMSDIKNVGYNWIAKCNQLISLPCKGLPKQIQGRKRNSRLINQLYIIMSYIMSYLHLHCTDKHIKVCKNDTT